jgi:signal transduction histidine kinase/CheY-like chemotaxis protein
MTLQQLLRTRRDDILATFVREAERKDLRPPGVSRSVLIDHLPVFLEEIIGALEQSRPTRDAVELGSSAREHGERRWKEGYDLEAVVREYGVLGHAIIEVAKSSGVEVDIEEYEQLARYLNIGVAEATAEYVRSREEQLAARQADLEFLFEAGELLGSSLDYQSTVTRLTRLLVPRLADFCVVWPNGVALDDLPIAHRDPNKLDLLRAALRHFPWPEGAHSHAEVIRTGEPVLVESTSTGFMEAVAQSPEHLALLQQLGARSWLAVPLRIKANTIGTITLVWSDSARRYGASDLFLVRELARAAASAIDNAQLYELARAERARAEAATRAKDEFVAVVTHELAAPLNVIIGWVRLLRSGSLPESRREHALGVIERNANAQSQLVADLLDISRVLTGRVRLNPAQVHLGNLLTLVLEDARLALESKRLELHSDITELDTTLRGDAERLRQIIWNLLLNAIKFTPKGGRIWISLRRSESDLELSVKDTGVGIEAEFLPHVFDSFRQYDSKTSQRRGGLGIGLAITKHLVDLHGGSVVARSDGVGHGASFLVRLPVSAVFSTTIGVTRVPATTPPNRRQPMHHEALTGVSVLIVDDEDDARELLRAVLESCNMEVHDAGGAREALAIVENRRIDVIISDIGMPDEDGYFLIRGVRALGATEKSNIPAIALTAFSRNEDRTRALLEGFNAHMAKPAEPAELLLALVDLLGA